MTMRSADVNSDWYKIVAVRVAVCVAACVAVCIAARQVRE